MRAGRYTPALTPEVPVSWGLPLAQRSGCGGCTRPVRYTNRACGCSKKREGRLTVGHHPGAAVRRGHDKKGLPPIPRISPPVVPKTFRKLLDRASRSEYAPLNCRGFDIELSEEGSMNPKPSTQESKAPDTDREFEVLLRRASELNKPNRLRLVKGTQPAQRLPRSAA